MYIPDQPDTESEHEAAHVADLSVSETPEDIIKCLAKPAADGEKDSPSSSEKQSEDSRSALALLTASHLELIKAVKELALGNQSLAKAVSELAAVVVEQQDEEEESQIPQAMSRRQ